MQMSIVLTTLENNLTEFSQFEVYLSTQTIQLRSNM